jgi:Domain of unknown function (DUF4157)
MVLCRCSICGTEQRQVTVEKASQSSESLTQTSQAESRRRDQRHPQPASLASGHLARLAASINGSQRVHALHRLTAEAQSSPRVQAQMKMAEGMNASSATVTQAADGEPDRMEPAPAPAPNRTGLPDKLKAGVETLSGLSLDDVKVHHNSAKPAQLNALAYAQGTDIHVAPVQEKHLPHEAWHIVQQKQGRVRPTMQMKAGVPVNDDAGLEHEADVMGARALGSAVQRRDSQIPEQGETRSHDGAPSETPGFFNGAETLQPRADHAIAAPAVDVEPEIDAPLRPGGNAASTLQRVPKQDNDPNYKVERQKYFGHGLQNAYDQLRDVIGSTLVATLGPNLVMQTYGANRTARLATVVLGLNGNQDIPQLANFFGLYQLATFLDFIALPLGVVQDYIRPIVVPVVPEPTLAVCYANLAPPGPYNPAGYQAFLARYAAGDYFNFDPAARQWAQLQNQYRAYVRAQMGGPVLIAAFLNAMTSGSYLSNGNAIVALPAWQVNANAETGRQIGQVNAAHPGGLALPAVNSPFGESVDRALGAVHLNYAAVAALVNNSIPKMNVLLRLLGDQPNLNMVAALQAYVAAPFGFDPLLPNRRPDPTYDPAWEAAFQAALALQPGFIAAATAPANFNPIRVALHAVDGGAAPNLVNPVAILAATSANNPATLPNAMANLAEVHAAVPNVAAPPGAGLPFGNRAGGLRGHFKKHVLGITNVDLAEPPLWLAILPPPFTRNDFGAMPVPLEADLFLPAGTWREHTSEFRGQAPRWFRSHVRNASPVDQARMLNHFQQHGDDVYANRLSPLKENAYGLHVSAAFAAPANQRYIYFQAGRVKINAWNTTDFIVAAFENGIWDLSSGYKPAMGANAKYNQERNLRFWEF